MVISPEKAEKLLEKNINNRNVSVRSVNLYAKMMQAGDWQEDSPQGIAIGVDGTIVDGQHRLMAIVKSKVTVSMWVATDVPNNVIHYLDTGSKRTHQDVFKIMDIANAHNVSAGVKQYISLKNNYTAVNSTVVMSIYAEEILREYEKNPDFWQDSHGICTKWYKKSNNLAGVAFILGWFAYFNSVNKVDAALFFDKIFLGTGSFTEKDPCKQIRDVLLRNKTEAKKTIKGTHLSAIFVKAWNQYRTGVYANLRWSPTTEPFPKAI